MITRGISGLDKATAFKEARWPELDGIIQGHDAAAALVLDGRVVPAAADRAGVECSARCSTAVNGRLVIVGPAAGCGRSVVPVV